MSSTSYCIKIPSHYCSNKIFEGLLQKINFHVKFKQHFQENYHFCLEPQILKQCIWHGLRIEYRKLTFLVPIFVRKFFFRVIGITCMYFRCQPPLGKHIAFKFSRISAFTKVITSIWCFRQSENIHIICNLHVWWCHYD